MIPKFLFCIFTAGFGANFVACATPPCGEIKEGSAELDLSSDAEKSSEKSNKNFLPFDFKGYLKNVGPPVKRIFGNKKATAAFSSFLFSGVFAYYVCNYFFKRRPTDTPLKGVETIDASEKVKEDVVTGDGTPNANTPDTTVSDTNTAISNDPESISDVNKLGNDRDYTVDDNLKESIPYPVLGIISLTVVVVCLLYYCYSVSRGSKKRIPAKYGTRENPFYLFDAEKSEEEEEDKGLKHGKNGNFDINHLFCLKKDGFYGLFVVSLAERFYKLNQDDLLRLKNLYFKISIKNLVKILDCNEEAKDKIFKALIAFKDQSGNVNFYISSVESSDKFKNQLEVVLFKDEVKEGQDLRRKVLSNKENKVKLRTIPFYSGYALAQIMKFIGNSKVREGKINEINDDGNAIPMIDKRVEVEGVDFF